MVVPMAGDKPIYFLNLSRAAQVDHTLPRSSQVVSFQILGPDLPRVPLVFQFPGVRADSLWNGTCFLDLFWIVLGLCRTTLVCHV
jgi:hypothetical protein